jgi:hypothetical protein
MDSTMETSRLWRVRWAAIGAAIAVSLGAGGGVWLAQAASPPSSVVMIEPERILDTRDIANLGLAGPFASPAPQDLQVTGAVPTATGTATVVPEGATGVLLNVTPVGATAAGFISVRPANASGAPTTSSLNFSAGEINPNSVQVELPTTGPESGMIEISYNAFGQVGPTTDVLIDVVGYTLAIGADAALVARVAALEAETAALSTAQPFAVSNKVDAEVVGADETVNSVSLTAPVAGQVTVFSTTAANNASASQNAECIITTGTIVTNDHQQFWQSPGASGQFAQMSGVRTFDVTAGSTSVYRLVCRNNFGGTTLRFTDTVLTALFTPGQ